MTSSESQPARKHHRHRNHSDRNVVQYLVLVVCVGVAVACVVGLILLLNSKMFIEAR
jgi:hypothetical protein